MINDLTAEQEILMSNIIKEWTKVPFDTSSLNKKKAESAINLTYENMKENRPKEIIWFDNPLEAIVWMMDNIDALCHIRYIPNPYLPNKIYAEGRSSMVSHRITWEDEITDWIYRDVPQNICDRFENNFNQVIHQKYLHWTSDSFLTMFLEYEPPEHFCILWSKGKTPNHLDNMNTRQLSYYSLGDNQVIAMHDIYYLAAAAFFHALGYDRSEFNGYWQAAKYCGLWWAFYDVAVAIPKPSEIYLDSEYKLYAEGKPALVYRGLEIHAESGKYRTITTKHF